MENNQLKSILENSKKTTVSPELSKVFEDTKNNNNNLLLNDLDKKNTDVI